MIPVFETCNHPARVFHRAPLPVWTVSDGTVIVLTQTPNSVQRVSPGWDSKLVPDCFPSLSMEPAQLEDCGLAILGALRTTADLAIFLADDSRKDCASVQNVTSGVPVRLLRRGETMVNTARLVLACVLGSAVAGAQPPSSPADEDRLVAVRAAETPIPLKRLAANVLYDQKPVWTFPLKASRGQHWKPVLSVALGTAALVVSDPYAEPYFHRSGFGTYKTGPLRGRNTTLAITMTPLAFYLTGLGTHSTHARNTGLLAAEAVADTQLLSFVMKHAVGRLKPSDIPANGNYRDTWFKYKGSLTNGGSFPSGHAASAFAVATVISARYREHRWIPWVAYGAATFIALTRLPDQAHFPSDIFFGAVTGYGISRFVVLGR